MKGIRSPDSKFVSFLVEVLSERTCSDGGGGGGADGDGDGGEMDDPAERIGNMLELVDGLFLNSREEDDRNHGHRPSLWNEYGFDIAALVPLNMDLEQFCQLPSTLLQEESNCENTQPTKRRKTASTTATITLQIKRTYAILGYMITHFIIQEHSGIIQFAPLQEYIFQKGKESGFISQRMTHSVEYDAFHVGFVSYLLDCMIASTDLNEDSNQGEGRDCWVRDDLVIEGLDVGCLVECLFQNW